MLNPGGSVKDRIALRMIEAAEREGLLRPGGTIVEPTSGNTGVGLAIAAAIRGYRCIFTMPDKMSREKISLLRAHGAEVVVTPTAVPPESPSPTTASRTGSPGDPGRLPGQPVLQPGEPRRPPRDHRSEIWEQTGGRITHFVAAVGTGGTISGTGRYLKEQNPDVVVVGADPEGSLYTGDEARPYLVEGIGEDFWPETLDREVVDRWVTVSDRDSFLCARRVTQTEGLLVGGSAGTAVHGALEVARGLGPDDVVVVILPDSGRSYLSKLYNDSWMLEYGFLGAAGHAGANRRGPAGEAAPRPGGAGPGRDPHPREGRPGDRHPRAARHLAGPCVALGRPQGPVGTRGLINERSLLDAFSATATRSSATSRR